MREVKLVGQKKLGKRNYLHGIYECPECGKCVEKIAKDGRVAKYCSHKCYAKNRERSAYKEFVIISGYKYLQSPKHHNCSKKGYVAEHRLIAENKLGRLLLSTEVVHHINGKKLDNRKENLMVLTNSEHIKLHKSKSYIPCEIIQ
jgi:DNA-directed RNA polymerase subunit RPC12/RpoP